MAVRLTKIYTKFGDAGETMLGDGSKVSKAQLRVEAYGTVDEANAAIGIAITMTPGDGRFGEARSLLQSIQHDMFDCGADLCVPVSADEEAGSKLRITQEQIDRIESAIDHWNGPLEPLSSFILPGGTPAAAHLHLARTVVRRAERVVAHLIELEAETTSRLAQVYLNRLSDLLFVLSRVMNDDGHADVLWEPGKTRGGRGEEDTAG